MLIIDIFRIVPLHVGNGLVHWQQNEPLLHNITETASQTSDLNGTKTTVYDNKTGYKVFQGDQVTAYLHKVARSPWESIN